MEIGWLVVEEGRERNEIQIEVGETESAPNITIIIIHHRKSNGPHDGQGRPCVQKMAKFLKQIN